MLIWQGFCLNGMIIIPISLHLFIVLSLFSLTLPLEMVYFFNRNTSEQKGANKVAENEDVVGTVQTEEEANEKALVAIINDLDNLVDLKYRNQGITITTGNLKGGVSKTTTNILTAYCLAKRGIRTLLVDMDQQGNASWTLRLTKMRAEGAAGPVPVKKTIMDCFVSNSVEGAIIPIIENLDLLPSKDDLKAFAKYLYTRPDDARSEEFLLKDLLAPIKENYDVILIDTPPHSMEITNNAIVASDYVFIPVQTQDYSLTGARTYYKDLGELKTKYDLDLLILGVVPVMLNKQSKNDEFYLESSVDIFGSDITFRTVITNMERIKGFAGEGIRNDDFHDNMVIRKYNVFTNEFVSRINEYEEIKEMEG